MSFPVERLRRLRRTPALRRLVAETRVTVDDLVAPLFVREDVDEPVPISSLPGQFQHSVPSLAGRGQAAGLAGGARGRCSSGCRRTGTRPVRRRGTRRHRAAGARRGPLGGGRRAGAHGRSLPGRVHRPRPLRRAAPPTGRSTTTRTLELYGQVALAQAEAGAQVVAPSGMMDGQVGGHPGRAGQHRPIRNRHPGLRGQVRVGALRAVPRGGGRGHRRRRRPPRVPAGSGQPARGAGREIRLDVAEGADIVMVKPAMTYLDVIADVRRAVEVPVAAYHVSGEYSMVKAAAERGWIDGAGRRAGAADRGQAGRGGLRAHLLRRQVAQALGR